MSREKPSASRQPTLPATGALRHQPLLPVFLAAASGVVLDRYATVSLSTALLFSAGALGLWLTLWLRNRLRTATFALLLAVAALAAAWHHACWHVFDADELACFAEEEGRPACIEGIALTAARWSPAPPPDPLSTMPRGERSELLVSVGRIRDGAGWTRAAGRLRVRVDGRARDFAPGDRLRIFGALRRLRGPRNPGEPSYADYQRCERQLCEVFAPSVQCIEKKEGRPRSMLRRALWQFRNRGNDALWKYVGPAQAPLASALLLGHREQLDATRTEPFWTTGAVHLLAISGLHVGILAYAFSLAVRGGILPRRAGTIAVAALTILYACLTDARPPVVRATVLICVFCAARLLWRRPLPWNTLSAAGLLVMALSPAQLFQVGTQLSFLAVATLSTCGAMRRREHPPEDPLARLIRRTRPWPTRIRRALVASTRASAVVSIGVWGVAAPLVLYRFHLLSLIGVPLNPLLSLPMTTALLTGFAAMLCGDGIPLLSNGCGSACAASLYCMEEMIRLADRVPGGHRWSPGPALWWIIIFYAAMAAFVLLPRVRLPARWRWALLAFWLAVGIWSSPEQQRLRTARHALVCHFVSVGHGTSVLVELPDGRTLLYDAGQLGPSSAGVRTISAVLWHRGIAHLDAVIISHADADHYNALPGLLERFSVGVIYVSPVMFTRDSPALDALRRSIDAARVPLLELSAGDRLSTGPVSSIVLHPPAAGVGGSDNANSIVLLLHYAGWTVMLPGDLETPGLEQLIEQPVIDCDLVMAPHHGSLRSDPGGFARWTQPEYVVISGDHLEPAARAAFTAAYRCHVLDTASGGAIEVMVDKSNFVVAPWLGGHAR